MFPLFPWTKIRDTETVPETSSVFPLLILFREKKLDLLYSVTIIFYVWSRLYVPLNLNSNGNHGQATQMIKPHTTSNVCLNLHLFWPCVFLFLFHFFFTEVHRLNLWSWIPFQMSVNQTKASLNKIPTRLRTRNNVSPKGISHKHNNVQGCIHLIIGIVVIWFAAAAVKLLPESNSKKSVAISVFPYTGESMIN